MCKVEGKSMSMRDKKVSREMLYKEEWRARSSSARGTGLGARKPR